ncbi:hypothetical protein D3C87_1656800 [compost metagenome]
MTHGQIRESFRRQIQVGTNFFQNFARIRARHVDRRNCRRDVGDVDVQPPLRIPLEHLLIDAIDATGSGGDVEVVFAEACTDAVVDHHSMFVSHQRIS